MPPPPPLHCTASASRAVALSPQNQEIAELKEEALRWSANETRLREINQQLLTDNMQLRAGNGWTSHPSPNTS